MHITNLRLKQFRCFSSFDITFEGPLILITGANGSGKTSLLEALHYVCYLRSFRTHLPKELVAFDRETFFIQARLQDNDQQHDIQVGFAGKKRVVKLNSRPVSSYKELNQTYRALTLTEDDMSLVQSGPETRRDFLDQALALLNPEYLTELRAYRTIVNNRNALLQKSNVDHELYHVWTEKLWQQSGAIQHKREELLISIQEKTNQLLEAYFASSVAIDMRYEPKKMLKNESFEAFLQRNERLKDQEKIMARSLFGAHLDDILCNFQHKTSRSFASRGQQKLTVLLLKAAFMHILKSKRGPALFLLDDFMTDFDPKVVAILMPLLQELDTQLIFTSPAQQGYFEQLLREQRCHHISLTP